MPGIGDGAGSYIRSYIFAVARHGHRELSTEVLDALADELAMSSQSMVRILIRKIAMVPSLASEVIDSATLLRV